MGSILILSEEGKGIPIARKLAQEGHIVRVYTQDERVKEVLKDSDNPSVLSILLPGTAEQFDLAISDNSNMSSTADKISDKVPILGGGTFSNNLSNRSEYSLKVVSKLLDLNPNFNEEEVADHLTMTMHGWFSKGQFYDYFHHSINYLRFLDQGRGCITDGMGTVLWRANESDEITQSALLKLSPLLESANYNGPIAIELVASPDMLYFNRFITHLDCEVILPWCELLKCSLFDFLWRIALGKDGGPLRDDYAVSVKLTVPPYPYNDEDVPIINGVIQYEKPAERHVFPSGVNSVVALITARGTEPREFRNRAYRTIHNIVQSRNVQYRRDIGIDIESRVEKLKMWGWMNA